MSWLARLDADANAIRAEGISNDIYAWHKKLWECYPTCQMPRQFSHSN
ncbi:MAG: hypothetical protein R3B95_02850 [Nitrospirales bacterium]|nr:hypothetical protein [Nitrospirales bacterium]